MLYQQGRAALPGFGEWILDWQSARIHPEQEWIQPGELHIRFVPNPEIDATSFIHFVATWQNIIPAVAELQVKKFLSSLENKWQQGEPIEIPLVGRLEKDEQGTWQFIESPLLQKGLEPLPCKPLSRIAASTPQPAAMPVSSGQEEAAPEQVSEDVEAYPFEDRKAGGKGWWIALGLLIILLALAWTAWDKGWLQQWQKKFFPASVNSSSSSQPNLSDTLSESVHVDSSQIRQRAFQLVIGSYGDSLQAAQLYQKVYEGWSSAFMTKDSESKQFLVIIPLHVPAEDTSHWVELMGQAYGTHPYIRDTLR